LEFFDTFAICLSLAIVLSNYGSGLGQFRDCAKGTYAANQTKYSQSHRRRFTSIETRPVLGKQVARSFAGRSQNREPLRAYQVPAGFAIKFGIWATEAAIHAWYGDWYARNMYIEGQTIQYHLEHYGHPSVWFQTSFRRGRRQVRRRLPGQALQEGWSEVLHGMGVHHDNFDLWNSGNAEFGRMGPRKDVVGCFEGRSGKRTAVRSQ
jgi:hypothetical protein